MNPTFKQFLAEAEKSLSDMAKGNNDRVTTYPKTNTKRFMDDWNDRLGPWVRNAEKKGYSVRKRVNGRSEGPLVLDVVDEDKLVSTAVIHGHDDQKSGNHTIDFYNQADVHQDNKYRVNPSETSYEDGWQWREMQMSGASHQNTRNLPMSGKDIGNSGRVDDADGPEGIINTPDAVDSTDDSADVPSEEFKPIGGRRRPPTDAAGAWGKLTKPRPGRKT